ncbi:DNA repair helicase rad25 [Trichodelitschia bisporula]|uniref:DNA 3'-5' helicase n=1 Tax=Trichodelitschia bisporula TaxID=703511 RepID=A0A6G1IAS0_9PEZI|nr:DNA repair helicase rad25 [Trichodelitschia bisporula]
MAPKRKATSTTNNRTTKRVASGTNTPNTVESLSDDDYLNGELSGDDAENVSKLMSKFSASNYHGNYSMHDAASSLFQERDFGHLTLKDDHFDRPLWIDPIKGRIIVESFAPTFKKAEDFLIAIAEPQSRVSRIHEYTMTNNSLYAAISVGYQTEDIIRQLEKFSKTPLPQSTIDFIITSTKSYGKARLVLKHTKYFVESSDPSVLQTFLRDDIISQYRMDSSHEFTTEAAPKMDGLAIPGTKMFADARRGQAQQNPVVEAEGDEDVDGAQNMATALLDEDDDEDADEVHSFEILGESVQAVRKRCQAISLPLTEEYDFRNDRVNPNLDIDLKPSAKIRPYQEQALSKMFGNGRSRSGIIVLPCGAGKTLVGITAACTVKKGIIVLCTSAMSVVQWRNEFLKWSNINPKDIAVFTADKKDLFSGSTGILISTYSMVTTSGKRSHDATKVMEFIEHREWGLMLLDEVHVVPAKMFQMVTYRVKAHSKLGLTATLLREDDKITELNFLIGPKLYEANWQELSEQGHIAKVQCAEVWCPMPLDFYRAYLDAKSPNKRMLLFTMNPTKFQCCQFLIDYHEKRGDKIIVFSDNVYALEAYAKKLNKVYIYGGTPHHERQRILENFQHNNKINTIFLSKIGDTSLDLPEATCLIQISSHFGSRRQEAQRLGRILRAKRRSDENFNAFFYTLVSKDTQEMYYAAKRQAFLVDQGYAFKVITHLNGIDKFPDLAFTTPQERKEMLVNVLLQNDMTAESEKIADDMFSAVGKGGSRKGPGVRRMAGRLDDLSGGQDMAYREFNKSRNKDLKGTSNFIKSLKKQAAKRREAWGGS